jgi:hypothetical protein
VVQQLSPPASPAAPQSERPAPPFVQLWAGGLATHAPATQKGVDAPQATRALHVPALSHVWTPLPAHCVSPCVHPQLAVHAQPPHWHAAVHVCDEPEVPHDRVAPAAHGPSPAHVPPCHTPPAPHVCALDPQLPQDA